MKLIELFKGLTIEYYLRQLFFGLLFLALFTWILMQGDKIKYGLIVFYVINTLLYPYSRFAYERIISFILGDTVLFSNIIMFTALKLITMIICWTFAIFIAPIGLLFIYFHQKRSNK